MATINLGRVGFVQKGTYSGATAYKINDVVVYNSGTYVCTQANTGQAPTNTSYWQNWVADNAVHKTGDETVAGTKTFSSPIKLSNSGFTATLQSGTLSGDVVHTLPKVSDTLAGISNVVGLKNYITNGNFDIWQRGTSFAPAGNGTRVADMWSASMDGNASITYSKSVEDILNGRRVNTLRVEISSIGTTTYAGIYTRLEDMMKYAGKTLTLSFYAISDSATPINVYFGRFYTSYVYSNAMNVGNGAAGALTKYAVTFTVPGYAGESYSEINSFLEIIIRQTRSTPGSFRIAQVQLEEGSVATPFEQRPYGLELSLCQRYLPSAYGFAGTGTVRTSTMAAITIPFKVEPRVAPTGMTVSGYATIENGGTWNEMTGSFSSASRTSANTLWTNGAASMTLGQGSQLNLFGNTILFTGCEL